MRYYKHGMGMRLQKYEKGKFYKKITIFNSRFDLRYFLLNTLSQLIFNGWWHCVCGEKEEKKCTICKLQIIFNNSEEDLNKNMFDEEFLYDYNTRLKYHLIELFETNKCALCCFLGDKYLYRGRDWTTGYTWNVPLSEQMKYEEKFEKSIV